MKIYTGWIQNGKISLYFYRIASLVSVSAIYISPNEDISVDNWITLGYAPENCRPSSTAYFGFNLFMLGYGGGFVDGRGEIYSSGEIKIGMFTQTGMSIKTSNALFGTFFYFINL